MPLTLTRSGDSTELCRGQASARGTTAVAALAMLTLLLAVSPWQAVPADPEPAIGAAQLMATLSDALFATLARQREAFRREPARSIAYVDELIGPHFDKEHLARLVLGTHWETSTEEQRQRFAAALYATLLSTYAASVVDWTPDNFRLLPVQSPADALQVVVRTEIARPGNPIARVDYRLRRTATGWKIYDVVVSGSSYARTYHDDIATELDRQGIEGVTRRLERPRRP